MDASAAVLAFASATTVLTLALSRRRATAPPRASAAAGQASTATGAGNSSDAAEPQVLAPELTWLDGRFRRGVTVVVDGSGRITAVHDPSSAGDGGGDAVARGASRPALELPGVALMPGFVNCHSHAFQRGLRGKGEVYPPSSAENSFWTWREEMYGLVKRMDAASFYELSHACFREMRASGITSVGEFHYFHHLVPDAASGGDFDFDDVVMRAARDAGLRVVLLNAFYCYGGFGKKPLSAAQQRFRTPSVASFFTHLDALAKRCSDDPCSSVGVVAHSMRAVDNEQLADLAAGADARGIVMHMHVEEQPKEVSDCIEYCGKTPMRVILDADAARPSVTAVHCNHTAPKDLAEFIGRGANVCVCPLTEGNLGDGIMSSEAAALAYAGRGATGSSGSGGSGARDGFGASSGVCLGTDCNARIDMFEEMRWLEYAQRLARGKRGVTVTAAQKAASAAAGAGAAAAAAGEERTDCARHVFACATENGARSLGLNVGAIEAGRWADFAAVDLSCMSLAGASDEDLMAALVFGCSAEATIAGTCVGGAWAATPGSSKLKDLGVPVADDGGAADAAGGGTADVAPAGAAGPAVTDEDMARLPPVGQLAVQLVNTASTSGAEIPMAKALKQWLTDKGWHVTLQEVAPQKSVKDGKPRFNVYAQRGSPRPLVPAAGDKGPRFLFNSHIDTVPPHFDAYFTDGLEVLHGRGACDTKGVLAAQLFCAQKFVEAHPELANEVGILYVVSEETDHSGMLAANELGLSPEFMVVGEPTESKLVKMQKGMLKCRLVATGTAAHSGYPHLGQSAIEPLVATMEALLKEEWPRSDGLGSTTLNIGTIEGGQAANALAEHAEALLMFRAIDDPRQLLRRTREIASEHGNGQIEVVELTMNHPVKLGVVDGFETTVVSFNTDIPYFTLEGTAYLLGPGAITDAHSPREVIRIADIVAAVDQYYDLMCKLLGVS